MEERREIRRKSEEEEVGKPRMVRELMGSRKATPVVVDFIAATQADQRAQRREEGTEKQDEKKDEDWGLNENKMERVEEED